MKFQHLIRPASDHLQNSFFASNTLNHAAADALPQVQSRLGQSPRRPASPPRLVRLALTEAEALAAQTGYPHLVFPLLAEEKVQQVTRWQERQHAVWKQTQSAHAFAA